MSDPVACLVEGCEANVTKIERYKVSVGWEYDSNTGEWDLGAYDDGTHFHVFCAAGHEVKCFGRGLPEELQRVVYPG